MTMRPPRLAALLFLAGLAACGRHAGNAPAAGVTLEIPALNVSDRVDWTGAKDAEPVVATVGGVPIPAGRLARAMQQAPGVAPDVVLRAVIAEEALAQRAIREAGGPVAVQPTVFERALVARLLDDRFARLKPEDVPPSELQELWNLRQVRARYDHLAAYEVRDLQWICCQGGQSCQTPIATACFDEGGAAMQKAYAELKRRNIDPEDLPLLVGDLRQVAPQVSFQEYQFAYDPVRKLQKGEYLFDEAVVRTVVDTPVGAVAPPVRSGLGWHILNVKEYTPPEHRGLEDPAVARQIAEFFLPRYQFKSLLEYLGTLVPADRSALLKPYFARRPAPAAAYDVQVFADALRDADNASAKKKEDEPL